MIAPNIKTDYVIISSRITYELYNWWGGRSGYFCRTEGRNVYSTKSTPGQEAQKICMYKPFYNSRCGDLMRWDINFVRWIEQQNLSFSYLTDVYVHEHPETLLDYKMIVIPGHSEYWTLEIRNAIENALKHRVHMAVFSGNTGYQQVRLDDDSYGNKNSIISCYRTISNKSNLVAIDPLYLKEPESRKLTLKFRELGMPENAFLGVMYGGVKNQPPWDDIIFTNTNHKIFENTGIKVGDRFVGAMGHEWDKMYDNGFTPESIQVLASNRITDRYGNESEGQTICYIHESGAFVFNSGTINWSWLLDDLGNHGNCGMDERAKKLTLNILSLSQL